MQQEESLAADYATLRRAALKRLAREWRTTAGILQEEVAAFLSCSRARIIEIEKEGSTSEYSVAEIELLAALLGRNPLDLLRMSGQESIEIGRILTELRTGESLLESVDCKLPKRLVSLFAETGDIPGDLVFSPSGELVASIVDSVRGERRMEGDPPYRLTVLGWEVRSGKLLGEIRLPDVEKVVPLDSERVALLTYQPFPEHRQTLELGGTAYLLVWNARTREVERKITLPERAQAAAVTPDSGYLAVYFAATTSVQVWHTHDWTPASAFELLSRADHHFPGGHLDTAVDVGQLARQRKFAHGRMDFDARRFDFLDNGTLVIGFETGQFELDVRPASRGYAHNPVPFGYPSSPFASLVHRRGETCEIAVTALTYEQHVGESSVQLYYLVPRRGEMLPRDAYVQVVRRFQGRVRRPVIFDDACVLSLVSYDTLLRRGWGFANRAGLLNLVSGRVVMLTDGGRLGGGDDQTGARLSPKGDAVAYWTQSQERDLRLTIQFLDHAALRLKGVSLSEELKLKRKRR